eukprot:11188178-Alexandrium_andersonii.AAC.1
MSASLVGSEMCIRDRVPCRPVSGQGALATCPDCGAEVRPSRLHLFWAVSYTHLTLPTICSV